MFGRRFFAFFERKTTMRKVLTWIIILETIIGCTGLKEIISHETEEDIWTGPGANIEGNPSRNVCYMTGIDYPQGYDWTDTSKEEENVRCSLMAFADGVPMLKIPIGEGYEISADPDMHKVMDGHLFTIFCTDGYTSIRKDGKAFIRYEGEEILRAMTADGENIHTLSVSRDGKGFTYRKNGELVLERRTGYAFERLHIDSDRMCFAFCQPVATTEGASNRYYIVRDGRSSIVKFDDDVTVVWDIMSHSGKTCALVSSGPWNTTELLIGDDRTAVGLPYGSKMLSCSLFSYGSEVGVQGLYSDEEGNLSSGIWVGGHEYMLFETGQPIAGLCSSEKDICCVLNPDSAGHTGTIFKSGKSWDMPEGYHFRGNNPIVTSNGELYIGLSSTTGSNPVLWKNGNVTEIRLNGPVCNLALGI